MSHINYFEPFESKSPWHEDQLTRAFLIVLRYSPSALLMFYQIVQNKFTELAQKKENSAELPLISEIDFKDLLFETQTTDLGHVEADFILSVLITDDKFEPKEKIKESTRGAVYDGIITLSNDIAFIIENKPRSYNVWEEQLHPNLTSLKSREDTELYEIPAIIEWKEIIGAINSILNIESIAGSEKLILNDFLDYVNRNFSFLNPYDRMSRCNGDLHLIQRRIKNILYDIAANEEDVKYQRGWANYIDIGLLDVERAGLEVREDNDEGYYLSIGLYFGDTVTQARNFYKRQIDFERIQNLGNGWQCITDLHLFHYRKHLVFFERDTNNIEHYYNYWLNHIDEIKQYPVTEIMAYLKILHDNNVIKLTNSKIAEMNDNFINTNRQTANLAPAIGLLYKIDRLTAEKLDDKGKLGTEFKKRFKEGLSILQEELKFLKDE